MKSKPYDILGLGCTAIDDLLYVPSYPAVDSKMRIRHRERHCGGLTATALVAAARLGSRCAFAGVLGEDELSRFVENRFCEEGIVTEHIRHLPEARPIYALIIVDESTKTRTILYDLEGAYGAQPDWPAEEVIRAARVLFVDQFGLEGMTRAARIAREAGIPVVADVETDESPELAGLRSFLDLGGVLVVDDSDPTKGAFGRAARRELLRALRPGNILLAADCAHIHPGNPDPAGPLQVKNASGKAFELHSFSTTFGIPGLGFAAGHKDVISILKMLLTARGFVPSSNSTALVIAALDHQEEAFQARMEILKKRRELLTEGLKKLGWRVRSVRLVPYIWAKPQVRGTSAAFARRLYAKAGIRVAPGTDFGEGAEGWLRLSLTVEEKLLSEALKRLNEHSRIWQRKYRPGD